MIKESKQRAEGTEVESRLAELLEYPFWASHYEALRGDPDALAAEVPRFRAALQAGGYSFSEKEVCNTLLFRAGYEAQEESTELEVAEEPLAGEVIKGWDADRAHEITKQALEYIEEHTQGVDLDAVDRAEPDHVEDEMWAACEAADLEAYINAIRSWASAWRRAAEQVRERE